VLKNGAYCWGDNSYGQLGDGHSDTVSSIPVQVWGLSSGVTGIDGGGYHTCAVIDEDVQVHHSSVSCWGYNRYGQLGNAATNESGLPTQVQGMSTANTGISAGYMHTCSLSNERAYCWGDNYYGQLGDNSRTARSAPTQVQFP
jgi:alpha-tubulin suppressor-like RCC1 family protein